MQARHASEAAAVTWRKYIADPFRRFSAYTDGTLSPIFYAPAPPATIAETEAALGTLLPDDLKAVLAETNGVTEHLATDCVDVEIGHFLWPIERIRETNVSFRSDPHFGELYMPFDCLLFFADARNGDQFAYIVSNEHMRRPDILAWNHEDDSHTWVAPPLKTFVAWWCEGKVKT